jgi:phosphate/sulfate permease
MGVAEMEAPGQQQKNKEEESLNIRTVCKIVTLWLFTVPFALLVSFFMTLFLHKLL